MRQHVNEKNSVLAGARRYRNFAGALMVGVTLAGVTTVPANAGYFNIGPDGVVHASGSAPEEFNYPGFKWEPGPNTSSNFGPTPSPGGATWSIMPTGLGLAAGVDFGEATSHGGNLTANFDDLLAAPGAEAAFVNQALNIWAAVSGFTNLGQVADGGVGAGASNAAGGHLGDIRIAAWEIISSTVLAHAFLPGTEDVDGPGGNLYGDLHMDAARTWVDDPADVTGDGDFDFLTVMLHEMGHALGLRHSDVVGSVMEPKYAGSRRTLQPDDIAGIQAIYGFAVPEPSGVFLAVTAACSCLLVCGWRRMRT